MLAIFLVLWLAILIFFKSHRVAVFYFIWGAVGCTIILIMFLRGTIAEYTMEYITGLVIHNILTFIGIETYIFDNAPGIVLVLLEIENSWSTIDIDIECSGLLETCVFIGLILFYPSFKSARKAIALAGGILGIYLINILRVLIIVLIMNNFGRDSIYIAHTLFGRMVFFFLLISLYWYIFTRESLIKIREHKNA